MAAFRAAMYHGADSHTDLIYLIWLAEAGAAVLIPASNNESHHHNMCYGFSPHAVSMYMMPR